MTLTRRMCFFIAVSLIVIPSVVKAAPASSTPDATPTADLLPDTPPVDKVATELWIANNGTMTVSTILARYSDAAAARSAFQAFDADAYADSTGFMVSRWDDDVLDELPEGSADAARRFQGDSDGPEYNYDWTVVALKDDHVAVVSMTGEWDSFSPQVLYDTTTRLIEGEAIDPPGYNQVEEQEG